MFDILSTLVSFRFYTDNGSVEPKKTFVLVFIEALELRQKVVYMGFFGKLTIVNSAHKGLR